MKIPEFFLTNYTGSCHLASFGNNGNKFICSNKPMADCRLASKAIPNKSLATAFANIDLENTEEILDFCKVYGLPYSSQKCLALRKAINSQEDSFSFHFDSLYLNEMLTEADYAIHSREALDDAQYHFWITEIVDEDIMPLILFNRCVKLVRSILNIQNWLLRYEGCPNSIIHSLAYLLFFAARGTDYLIPQTASPTLVFAKKIAPPHSVSQAKLFEQIEKIDSSYCAKLQSFLAALDKKTIRNIHDYDKGIITQEQLNIITESEAPAFQSVDREFAQSVIYHIINDGISMSTSKISVIDGVPVPEWHTTYLMNAIYLDLYFSIINADTYKKCLNPQCGKYFSSTDRRADAVYCSNACASKMGKKGKYVRISKL